MPESLAPSILAMTIRIIISCSAHCLFCLNCPRWIDDWQRARRGPKASKRMADDDDDDSFLYSGIEKESGGSNGATSPSLLPPDTRCPATAPPDFHA